jgi:hypothetical protein
MKCIALWDIATGAHIAATFSFFDAALLEVGICAIGILTQEVGGVVSQHVVCGA